VFPYSYEQAGLPIYAPVYPPTTYPAAAAQPRVAVAAPAPKVRLQAPDDPKNSSRRVAMTIPTPEQLGLIPSSASAVDWSATRVKLRQLGASSFQLDHTSAGGFRFTCWLPAEQSGKSYRIEAEAKAESDAVKLCLERTERWLHR
jgi:hypothetical protein